MEESTYALYLFYRSGLFGIVIIQTDDILIFANNNFASEEEVEIKAAKIMMKDQEYFAPTQLLKFNEAQINLDSESIILTKESHIDRILLVTDYDADSASSKRIIRKKLLSKE